MMTIEQFKEQVFMRAQAMGFDEYELYYQYNNSLSLQGFEGDIVSYAESITSGVNFRGTVAGKAGSCFSEVLDQQAVDMLVNKAYEAATLIENDDQIHLVANNQQYATLELYNPNLKSVDNTTKVEFVLKTEKQALAEDAVEKVSTVSYSDGEVAYQLHNSKGLSLNFKRNYAQSYIGVIAADGEDKRTAYEFVHGNQFTKITGAPLVKDVAKRVSAKLGAKPVNSGNYQIVLSNEASASLLGVFISAFSADAVQKGMSQLKGKLGKAIASDTLSLIDDPHLENGLASTPFDGEGTATYKKSLIQNGILNTFLHNLKTAQKDGITTTGNASRGSYKANIGVAPTNCYIKPSEISLETLLDCVGHGLVITEFDGLHAGANAVTGDFSLSARGFILADGKLAKPVNQIVVSGNYFNMLKQVRHIANDLVFRASPIGSPTIAVGILAVAGSDK